MKNLLVVFTGGTIGSKQQGAGIDVNQSGSYALIEGFMNSSHYREDVMLDAIQPLNMLSENICPSDWLTLAAAIRGIDMSAYHGVIITHGSDTLAYSAAMFSYLFADTSLPIVLTASNYPLSDGRSNGSRNFANAVHYIADAGLPGVFVVYENDQGEPLVYLGTRITQAVSFTDQFGSPYDEPFGRIVERNFEWHASVRSPEPKQLMQQREALFTWEPHTLAIDTSIVYIKPFPGLNYTYYDFSNQKPKAVLHDLHHSGTACAIEEGPYSLLAFMSRCLAQGIDFYICPIKDRTDALYSSSLRLIEAGATVIENMSMEAAVTKLMLAYGIYDQKEQVEAFMNGTTLYYERNEV
ncbi:L-asparaginase [Paenibacillus castaneae]|uniref:asparaginase n=1 Tax=Paenibacillus castaneae TaxID=474957 RepID=UPI00141B9E7C|nr:asparaginase domain-containing protein [Paenibacillus castaneae]NIK79476.1 L-asparaginase [Paenibacillus castaneae]